MAAGHLAQCKIGEPLCRGFFSETGISSMPPVGNRSFGALMSSCRECLAEPARGPVAMHASQAASSSPSSRKVVKMHTVSQHAHARISTHARITTWRSFGQRWHGPSQCTGCTELILQRVIRQHLLCLLGPAFQGDLVYYGSGRQRGVERQAGCPCCIVQPVPRATLSKGAVRPFLHVYVQA
jgi:hypothetical protein